MTGVSPVVQQYSDVERVTGSCDPSRGAGVGTRRRGPVRLGLLVGSSLATLALALGPVAAQTVPARSPSTLGLTKQDFETREYWNDWGLGAINASTAYARGFTGLGVLVAVIDTGIDATHPEFRNLTNPGGSRISPASADFYEWYPQTPTPFTMPSVVDRDGHGTHVAGTIAAARDGDPAGMMGVAFESRILALRAIVGTDDSQTYNRPRMQLGGDTAAAIEYAAQNGARIINGSYGYSFKDSNLYQKYSYEAMSAEHQALKEASSRDVLSIFAAGNNHVSGNLYNWANASSASLIPYIRPENANSGVYRLYDINGIEQKQVDFSDVSGYIVAVVNVDEYNRPNWSSNLCGAAAAWCISAPGTNIYSTWPLNMAPADQMTAGYYSISGTSMAAPHVAGAAAVLRQAFPFLTAPQIAQTMFTTATHLGDGPANAPNATFGWGLLNLGKAIDGPGQFTSDWTVNTTYNGQAYYGRFANAISGVGGLTKVGLGTLELAGTNTYAGPTTVAGGTLFLSASGSLTSPVSVQSAGTYLNAGWTQGSVSNAGLLINTGTISGGATNAGTALSSGVIAGGVANSGTLSNSGTVAGGLTNTGTALNTGTIGGGAANSGSLVNAGTLAGGLSNTGTALNTGAIGGGVISSGILSNSGAIGGGVANTGLLATSGTISGGLTNAGTVLASAGRIDGAIANNAGLLAVAGSVAGTGPFANAAGATLAVTGGGSYSLAGPLANAGLVAVAQSASLTASGGLSNAGLVASDGTLTADLTNTGVARLSGQFNGTLTNTGLVQITGPLAGLTGLTNTGALDLGGTALTLTDLAGPASAVLGNG
ncbi:S8 family serine peptidase, partial [Methylobacterium sp. NPDC080182]|uniref:S8 family peptidase n=1 Tax=Methylobacterium sp. NPDC080182 TaxID=3390590 RepID=UPI003CFC6007